jgi:hypothetical protein
VKNLLLFLSLSILARPVLPVFEYVIDYGYISTQLCINKDKPELHCNGKCHLMKKLAAASENEKPLSSDKKHAAADHTDWIAHMPVSHEGYFAVAGPAVRFAPYGDLYGRLSAVSVFHPPA